MQRAEKYLSDLRLWDRRQEISRNLSGGMKRRLMIARALMHEPKLLILDEPTAGVDIEIRRSMWKFLQETNKAGTTIILTTHYLEEAETLCRNVAIIDEGRIIEDDRMTTILRKLKGEIFILSLDRQLTSVPTLDGFQASLRDDCELEVSIGDDSNLNTLFAALSAQGITVTSLRNKSNRLEELFMRLVDSKQSTAATG